MCVHFTVIIRHFIVISGQCEQNFQANGDAFRGSDSVLFSFASLLKWYPSLNEKNAGRGTDPFLEILFAQGNKKNITKVVQMVGKPESVHKHLSNTGDSSCNNVATNYFGGLARPETEDMRPLTKAP